LIDIRSAPEHEKLHIPGTTNIPSDNLPERFSEFNKEETIVCVCNHGKERSQQAADLLYNAGFKNTFYLEGGTAAWSI
jgi:rhodanese-related sulfurtransferase